MKIAWKTFIAGTAFGAAALHAGSQILESNKLDTEEDRLATKFVKARLLKNFPEIIPHEQVIVKGAKSFMEEHGSVICFARGKKFCMINETHEQSLLRAVLKETISAISAEKHLNGVRKDLENILNSDTEEPVPEEEPVPQEEKKLPSMNYALVSLPAPSP